MSHPREKDARIKVGLLRGERPTVRLLNQSQVAALLGCHWRTVNRMVRAEGDFPRPRLYVGRSPKWAVADLEAWIADVQGRRVSGRNPTTPFAPSRPSAQHRPAPGSAGPDGGAPIPTARLNA